MGSEALAGPEVVRSEARAGPEVACGEAQAGLEIVPVRHGLGRK